ncbi:MAG: hypothetical protein AVDCRST_MAG26-1616 [uncultured Chloroflexia bacterium]|uniref:GPP34 family phosphoprotein n=1 Tax=uncultured Chloroflexia bacterium TaxID=1672391 RepID=A0A6J4I9V7_9CHLR|nr:MAG: hypothetical protein AVDCRST_MAG26-1616 [uncultured Chloroflexia bacterium]
MLTLPEQLLLLALDDRKGTSHIYSFGSANYGLYGALLMELAVRDRLERRDKDLVVTDATPAGDAGLDEALRVMAQPGKPRDPAGWATELAQRMPRLEEQLLDRLVAQGLLRREQGRVLWIFPRLRYLPENDAPEQALRAQLRAVLLDGAAPEPRTAALIQLVDVTGLVNTLFPHAERKAVRARIEELKVDPALSTAIGEKLRQIYDDTTAAMVMMMTAASADGDGGGGDGGSD